MVSSILRRSNMFHVKVDNGLGPLVWQVLVHVHDNVRSSLNEDVTESLKELWAIVRRHQEVLFQSVGGGAVASKSQDDNNMRKFVGQKIQLLYSRRPTAPHCTILTYGNDDQGGSSSNNGKGKGHLGSLRLCETTLILWLFSTAQSLPNAVDSHVITSFLSRQRENTDGQEDRAEEEEEEDQAKKRRKGNDAETAGASTDPIDLTASQGDDGEEEDAQLKSVLARLSGRGERSIPSPQT